jgi:hypothetical protein
MYLASDCERLSSLLASSKLTGIVSGKERCKILPEEDVDFFSLQFISFSFTVKSDLQVWRMATGARG